MKSRMTRKLPVLALAVTAALMIGPTSANAGVLVASATDCAEQSLDQNFIRFADVANYTPLPGGDFEQAGGWALAGGAAVVSGNEPFNIAEDPSDSRSLSLPAGASAKSNSICVGIEYPDIRFVARSSNPAATLRVDVYFEDGFGNVQSAPVAVVNAGASWSPSLPLPVAVNLLPLLPGERTAVAFKFSASGGSFQVDNIFVDPYRSI